MRKSAVAIGGVALAAICCLAAPIAAGLVGGVALAVLIGWGALVVACVAASALVISRVKGGVGDRGDRG